MILLSSERLEQLEALGARNMPYDEYPGGDTDTEDMARAMPALVAAARKLAEIRALVNDRVLPARFVVDSLRELLTGPVPKERDR